MTYSSSRLLTLANSAYRGNFTSIRDALLDIRGVMGSISATTLAYLASVTAGTVAASKAMVVDSNKDIGAVRDITVRSVLGLAAAQGVAVIITGGTSSTTGNAGGALTFTGGVGGLTGDGGAANIAGNIGGATSGTGGQATLVGGAGTGVTTTGGLGKTAGGIGGTGTTTSAGGVGGAAQLISGDGGAKTGTGSAAGGAAGAVTITGGVGGATASTGTGNGGAGSTVTITSGAGGAATGGGSTGNGGAGGNINLVLGAGGATVGGTAGLKGEVQIGGNASGFIPLASEYNVPAAAAHVMYTAPRPMRVKSIIGRPIVVGSGGACTAAFYKAPSATALSGGTALLASGSYDFVGTTLVNQVLSLSATAATLELAAGDSIGYVVTGTSTSATGTISITLAPTQ